MYLNTSGHQLLEFHKNYKLFFDSNYENKQFFLKVDESGSIVTLSFYYFSCVKRFYVLT